MDIQSFIGHIINAIYLKSSIDH